MGLRVFFFSESLVVCVIIGLVFCMGLGCHILSGCARLRLGGLVGDVGCGPLDVLVCIRVWWWVVG